MNPLRLKIRRIRQVLYYGWGLSKTIAKEKQVSRWDVFIDIFQSYRKYHLWTNQYKKEKFYTLSQIERETIGKKYQQINDTNDKWPYEKVKNIKFLKKWKDYKWELSYNRNNKRNKAYTNYYNMGNGCYISFDVVLEVNHFLPGIIKIGNNVLLSKHVYIDYSGEVVLSDNVKLSAGVTIESHRHIFEPGAKGYEAVPTNIIIEEGVWIGQRALICEDCKRIGRYAQIGAGAIIRNPIPPYAIVLGNPAKIVGFLYTPEEVEKFEKDKYPEKEQTDIEKYTKMYNKYFINRISEIKKSLNN